MRFSRGGLNASLAYFQISRANAVVDPASNVFLVDGTNSFKGIEATAAWEINKSWTINTAGQYLRAVQEPERNQSLKGLVPENTPKFTGNLTVTHKSQWVKGLTVNAGASYVGPRFVNALNQAQIPGVTLFSAGVGYSTHIMGLRGIHAAEHREPGQQALLELGVQRYVQDGAWSAACASTPRWISEVPASRSVNGERAALTDRASGSSLVRHPFIDRPSSISPKPVISLSPSIETHHLPYVVQTRHCLDASGPCLRFASG